MAEEHNDRLSTVVRRLLKLGQAPNLFNVRGGAPHRFTAAYGSLSSVTDQWYATVLAKEATRRAKGERVERSHDRVPSLIRVKHFWMYLSHFGT